ncbi:MAG TPA: hypothetical protein VMW48_01710, partial [Vicinamibacterales bacterium]|nr:hypothetical protein [Vicinamibacterales bacterium]
MTDSGVIRSRNHRTALHALSAVLLALGAAEALGASGPPGRAHQESPAPAVRPADEMPLDRVTPDARIAIALAPGAVATDDAVWVPTANGVARIDAKTNAAASAVALPAAPCANLIVAFGSLWAPLCTSGTVARMDMKTQAVTTPLTLRLADAAGQFATAVGSVWVASEAKGVVSRVDPDTNDVVAEVFVAREPVAVVGGDDALWITSTAGGVVTRVNPHTNAIVETVKVGPAPGRVVVGEGAVWTLNRGDGSVSRIDPKTNTVVA